MPGGDGTGPDGTYDRCVPTDGAYAPRSGGFGRRHGRGRRFWNRGAGTGGRGRGNMFRFNATGEPGWRRAGYAPTVSDEVSELREQLKDLEEAKENLEKRLDEITKK